MFRAAVAIALFVAVCLLVRWLSQRRGHDGLNGRSKVGLGVTFVALLLWVPTTTTLAFGAPSLFGFLLTLAAGLVLALVLFLVLGPLGMAGWFGATKLGLMQYLAVFGSHTLFSYLFGGLVRLTTKGVVPIPVVAAVAMVGFVLIAVGVRRKAAATLSLPKAT